jgi:hypothetical protein
MLFHARIAAERPAGDGGFTADDVADTLAAKLTRRHQHVFGSVVSPRPTMPGEAPRVAADLLKALLVTGLVRQVPDHLV